MSGVEERKEEMVASGRVHDEVGGVSLWIYGGLERSEVRWRREVTDEKRVTLRHSDEVRVSEEERERERERERR